MASSTINNHCPNRDQAPQYNNVLSGAAEMPLPTYEEAVGIKPVHVLTPVGPMTTTLPASYNNVEAGHVVYEDETAARQHVTVLVNNENERHMRNTRRRVVSPISIISHYACTCYDVCLFALVAVAAAKPGFLSLAPAAIETRHTVLGSETTVESHGNSVVHASAPVVTGYAAAPAVAVQAAPVLAKQELLSEKTTIESHGNSVVHGSAPVVTGYAAYAAPTYYAAAPAHYAYAASPLAYAAAPAHYIY
uniref:Cuticle protein n=1 Tax=Trichogramma kaykai TaxID=54128 RepID=A0ABD2XR34_9HYME